MQAGQIVQPVLGYTGQSIVVQFQLLDVVHPVERARLQQPYPIVTQLQHPQLGQMLEREPVYDFNSISAQLTAKQTNKSFVDKDSPASCD